MIKPILLILVLIFFSCQNKSSDKIQNLKKPELNIISEAVKSDRLVLNDTVFYLSEGNDLAFIKLTLIPNGTFDFYMSIYPEPMQKTDSEPDLITSSGLWNGNKKSILLTFAKRENDTLNLKALFSSKYKEGNEFNVIDQNSVEINHNLEKINIWGIGCYKTENKNKTEPKKNVKTAYDWEYIKSKTSELTKSFDIENLDIYKLPEIPKGFLEQFIKDKR